MSDLYREEILEHYNNPQNFGKLVNFTISSRQTNPLCGDDIEIFVQFDKKSLGVNTKSPPRCTNISFLGKGCALSIAAASFLTEFSKGKSKRELEEISEQHMLDLLQIEVSESRKKCALLAFYTLKDLV